MAAPMTPYLFAALCGRTGQRRPRNREDAFDLPEEDFRRHFRMSKALVRRLCADLEGEIGTKGPTGLPTEAKVLCALRFFATGSFQTSVGSEVTIQLSQSSMSRCISAVALAITRVGKQRGWVIFPSTPAKKQQAVAEFLHRGRIPGVVGCIDGTLVAISQPKGLSPGETQAFMTRKGYYALNTMLLLKLCSYVPIVCCFYGNLRVHYSHAFFFLPISLSPACVNVYTTFVYLQVSDSKLRILAIDPRRPGCTHDAFCWKHSFLRRRIAEQGLLRPGEFLLGDSGYPLEPWLMTPVPGHPSLQTPEGAYNHAHSSMRTAVERCIGVLKSRFRCLQRYRTLHYSPKRSATIIAACAALHNLCLEEGDPFDGSCSSDDNSDSEDSEQEDDTAAQNAPPTSTRSTLTKAKAVRCRIVHFFSLPRLQHTAYLRRVRQRVIRQLARQRQHTSQ
nr:putative nuclease HARBI1 [Dermacentor andersoni]